jgi:molybdopterin synthase catalytic subunit
MNAMAAVPIIDVQLFDHPVRMLALEPFPREAGGECVFLGRTRLEHHPQHGELRRLSYEAYREMAERVLRDLAQQTIERFECFAVRVHHAIGEVPVGEASVLVQVVCGHRDKAFAACRFLIDRLKSDAPIWKREQWERGETWSEAANVPGVEGVKR